MEKEDAIAMMHHISDQIDDVVGVEDMVAPFAEFLAHIRSEVSESDFAFLATIGAMIYRKGFHVYDSSMQTDMLMQRLRQ
jgi:hypothetical protein